MKTDDGGSAFPHQNHYQCDSNGMTLRDWFAGMALQGLSVSNPDCPQNRLDDVEKWRSEQRTIDAEAAYAAADAMLTARAKEKHE